MKIKENHHKHNHFNHASEFLGVFLAICRCNDPCGWSGHPQNMISAKCNQLGDCCPRPIRNVQGGIIWSFWIVFIYMLVDRNDRVSSLYVQKFSPVYKNPARRYHVAEFFGVLFHLMDFVGVFFQVIFIIIDSDRDFTNKNCPGSIRIQQGGIMLRSNEGRMMVLSPSVGCHTTTTAYFFNLGKQQQQFLSQYRFLIIIMFLWLMLCPFCWLLFNNRLLFHRPPLVHRYFVGYY